MRSLLLVSDLSDFSAGSPAAAGLASSADTLILDLSNAAGNADTRNHACDFLRSARLQPKRPKLYVRIPLLDDPSAIATLDDAIGAGAEGIVLPEALGGHDVTRLDARISVEEAMHAIDHGRVKIIAEAAGTARAALGLASFRGASHRLTGLIWSDQRLAGDMGLSVLTSEGHTRAPLSWARGHFLLAASAAGVLAIIDGSIETDGLSPSRRYAAAREDGFNAGLATDVNDIATIAALMAGPIAR